MDPIGKYGVTLILRGRPHRLVTRSDHRRPRHIGQRCKVTRHPRQGPDRLAFLGGTDAVDIGGGGGWPIQHVKRGFRKVHQRFAHGVRRGMLRVFAVGEIGGHRPRLDLVAAQKAHHLGHLAKQADQVVKVGFLPDQLRHAHGSCMVWHTLRQAGDTLRLDPERTFAR